MARNGSGTYSLPSGNPVVTGSVISSTTHNTTMSDIATALTASLAKDGQTTPSANLPMGTYRHTGVGNALARDQYASVAQVQDGSLVTLSTVSGTNTITATAPLSMSAYALGQCFRFVASAANTDAVTININSIGVKSITKDGTTALVAGDIQSGAVCDVVYDGTRFQLINPANRLVFQSSTTNGETNVGAIPNGTGEWAAFTAFSNPDVSNASNAQVGVSNSTGRAWVMSGKTGTGTVLPLCFDTNSTERMRLSADAPRLQADFSNATIANRLALQTSVADGITAVPVLPNGTGRGTSLVLYDNSGPTNCSYGQLLITGLSGVVGVVSGKTGTGTYLPLVFQTGGAEQARIETDGRFSYKNYSVFSARKSADQSLPSTSQYTVSFDTYDYGSGALSSSVFVAPKDGVYAFAATIRIANTTGSTAVAIVGLEATTNSGGTVAVIDVDANIALAAGNSWYGKLYREYRLLTGESVLAFASASVSGVTVDDSNTWFTGRYVGTNS